MQDQKSNPDNRWQQPHIISSDSKSGQRDKEWFLKRHCRWTASTISKLMSEQGKPDKSDMVFKWGIAAKTALFNKFYQRLTNIMEKEIEPTLAMQRGIDLEPMAIERFGELYLNYALMESAELVDTGFILFPDDDGTREWEKGYKGENSSAGASADQLLLNSMSDDGFILKDILLNPKGLRYNVVSGIETKARGESASNSHAFSAFDVKHEDFWQVQSNIHTHGVKYWYYLNYDDEKPIDWSLDVKLVPASPIHIKKMCTKIKDADGLIDGYLERCKDIHSMMPDKKGELLTEIYCEIRDLKEKW